MAELTYFDVGRCSYARGLALQDRLAARAMAAEDELAYLLLLEHDPPVITLGRSARPEHVLASPRQLAAAGVEVHKSTRGGDVTYHAPGQLVGYPILRIDLHGRDVRRYLRDLEEALIRTLAAFGLTGRRRDGLTGVWVGGEKIAAIGVAIRKRCVACHGFALNVCPDLKGFEMIVPCGIRDCAATSMERLLGRPVAVAQVMPRVVQCFVEVFGFDRAVEGAPDG